MELEKKPVSIHDPLPTKSQEIFRVLEESLGVR
jgi:hypothetical protein